MNEFKTPLHEQLHWAEQHASDFTMAEHNRKHFELEAVRLRAALARAEVNGNQSSGGECS